jgi:hypothetical protein
MGHVKNLFLLLIAGAASNSIYVDSTFQFRPERVLAAQRDVRLLSLIDMNTDGKPDILARDGPQLVWLENPKWTPHVIADGAAPAESASQFGWVRCIRRLVRVEADRLVVDTDLITTQGHGKGVACFEAPDWKMPEIYPALVGPHSLARGSRFRWRRRY